MSVDERGSLSHTSPARKSFDFLGLILTTTTISILVAGTNRNWTTSGQAYTTLNTYRSSVQIVVQLLSAVLGYFQVCVVCRLINFATRIRFSTHAATLDTLYAWSSLSMPRVGWGLPIG